MQGSNLRAAALLVRAVLPGMMLRGGGRVVFIAGTFAMRGLARSLAHQAGPHGITVNCVCPGLTRGPRAQAAIAELAAARGIDAKAAERALLSGTGLGRLVEPEEIAAAVVFLCGPGGGAITGQDIVVDAGATA